MRVRILTVIPVYNHPATLREVAAGAVAVLPDLLVVDDGSAIPVGPSLSGLPLHLIRHETNRGKGAAIKTAAAYATTHGFSHLVTLDADGQHDPADLARFAAAAARRPRAFIIGARDFARAVNVPFSSRFGRRFSEFWMFIQTGRRVGDMQSGYRAYPVAALGSLTLRDDRYSFEIEVLVKAAWSGFEIVEIPVPVRYPAAGDRVSHFRAFRDNWRITILNTRLTIRAMVPVPFQELAWEDGPGQTRVSVRRPLQALRRLMADSATPRLLAVSTAVALFVNCLPLPGLQTFLLLWLIAALKLNRPWSLAVSHACLPGFMPALAIEVGHYVLAGTWLTELSWHTLGREAWARLGEWLAGALVGGPPAALAAALAVYLAARLIGRGLAREADRGR
jgi:uncharacterized protein (DUF2062 family)